MKIPYSGVRVNEGESAFVPKVLNVCKSHLQVFQHVVQVALSTLRDGMPCHIPQGNGCIHFVELASPPKLWLG